jgi:hypothetical protein
VCACLQSRDVDGFSAAGAVSSGDLLGHVDVTVRSRVNTRNLLICHSQICLPVIMPSRVYDWWDRMCL